MNRQIANWAVVAACASIGTASAAERALDKTIDVPASVDAVWDAWTTRAGIVAFMAPDAEIDPRPGGLFEVRFDPLAGPGDRGADDMRYLALQPKKMLSYTWNAPPHLPQARQQRTFVIVRFEPLGDRATRVKMHHTGWGDGGEWDQAYAYFDKAWSTVLGNLKKRFETGPIDWTEWMDRLRSMHGAASAPR